MHANKNGPARGRFCSGIAALLLGRGFHHRFPLRQALELAVDSM
jgi:hypothetical protein